MSGQAASKWARGRGLPIEGIDDLAAVRQGRTLVAALHRPRWHRP